MLRLRRPPSVPHLLRRVLAAVLASAALVLAVRPLPGTSAAVTDPAPAPVVVAATDLAAGTVLLEHDLTVARWPADLVPTGATAEVDGLAGRTLAGSLRAGEPVTDLRLVGPGLTSSLGGGQVAAPVRLADLAVAGLVRPGDRVDVLATAPDADTAEVVVAGALVLAPPAAPGNATTGATEGLLLLAVAPETGARLAAAAARDTLSVTLAPP
jgi:Flp pilus assembly protein CpaB